MGGAPTFILPRNAGEERGGGRFSRKERKKFFVNFFCFVVD